MSDWVAICMKNKLGDAYKIVSEYVFNVPCIDGMVVVRFKITQRTSGLFDCFTSHYFGLKGGKAFASDSMNGTTEEEAFSRGFETVLGGFVGGRLSGASTSKAQFIEDAHFKTI